MKKLILIVALLFTGIVSNATHRMKEWIAKLTNHVLDLNINKAEQSIIRKMDYNDGLPF